MAGMAVRAIAVLLGLSGLLAGCGAGKVEAADVETQISEQLEAQVGERPDSVDCPEDLPAEVDAMITCDLTTVDGDELGVEVTVTSVEDDTVNFDIEVVE